jgi:hypothetical protein
VWKETGTDDEATIDVRTPRHGAPTARGGRYYPVSSRPPPVNAEKGANADSPQLTMSQDVVTSFAKRTDLSLNWQGVTPGRA